MYVTAIRPLHCLHYPIFGLYKRYVLEKNNSLQQSRARKVPACAKHDKSPSAYGMRQRHVRGLRTPHLICGPKGHRY